MKSNIELSIIIPVYNSEKYLRKCLESVIRNKFNNMEIILINDGSIDNSDKICKEYASKDKRINYITKKNEGCSVTRNLGINQSKGKYIWFIDSDDYIEDRAIEKIINILKEKKVDLILFGQKIVYPNQDRIFEIIPKNIKEIKDLYKQKSIFNSLWNKVYRADLIKKEKIFFPETCHMGEDLNFNFKIINFLKDIEVIKEPLYYYLGENGVSSITNNIEKKKEIFLAFDDILEYLKNKENYKEIKYVIKEYYILNAIYYSYLNIRSSNYNYFEKRRRLIEIEKQIIKRKGYFNTTFFLIRMKNRFKLLINEIEKIIKIKKLR